MVGGRHGGCVCHVHSYQSRPLTGSAHVKNAAENVNRLRGKGVEEVSTADKRLHGKARAHPAASDGYRKVASTPRRSLHAGAVGSYERQARPRHDTVGLPIGVCGREVRAQGRRSTRAGRVKAPPPGCTCGVPPGPAHCGPGYGRRATGYGLGNGPNCRRSRPGRASDTGTGRPAPPPQPGMAPCVVFPLPTRARGRPAPQPRAPRSPQALELSSSGALNSQALGAIGLWVSPAPAQQAPQAPPLTPTPAYPRWS